MSDPVQPHRRQPTRPPHPHPWDSPGKSTGVGCHFLLQCMKVKSQSEVAQSCPTLSNPMDCSPPGSSVHGILQARVLEWGAIAFSHFKHQVLFYTFSKALGQRIDIFSSPSPILLSHCCLSNKSSCLSDSLRIVFTCDYIVTHAYVWAAYHISQFISYLSKSCLSLVS